MRIQLLTVGSLNRNQLVAYSPETRKELKEISTFEKSKVYFM